MHCFVYLLMSIHYIHDLLQNKKKSELSCFDNNTVITQISIKQNHSYFPSTLILTLQQIEINPKKLSELHCFINKINITDTKIKITKKKYMQFCFDDNIDDKK